MTAKKITLRQPAELPSADDWVSGGAAAGRPLSASTARPVIANPEKLARLTIDLPQELHGQFKAVCAQHRTKMKDEVLRFIEEWTQKHRNQ